MRRFLSDGEGKKVNIVKNKDKQRDVKKIREASNHKSKEDLIRLYQSAGKLDDDLKSTIIEIVDNCGICKRFKKTFQFLE